MDHGAIGVVVDRLDRDPLRDLRRRSALDGELKTAVVVDLTHLGPADLLDQSIATFEGGRQQLINDGRLG